MNPNPNLLWTLAFHAGVVLLLVAFIIGLSSVLGERHAAPATGEPYESGVVSTGSARLRFSPRFHLIAMFFVVFDLESVYLFTWATAVREVGWLGFWEILVFVAVLLIALGYLWRTGSLDIGAAQSRRRHDP